MSIGVFSAPPAVLATVFSTTGTASEPPWTSSSLTLATGSVMAAALEHEEDHSTLATPHLMLHQTHMAYWPTHVASHRLPWRFFHLPTAPYTIMHHPRPTQRVLQPHMNL